mmetsp:Transcript_5473/g.12893  ORF Transcript_5473/g.12893 Transcript_5473/m.12893 type:complete len:219 (+) Transcript_5473:117-773(+)
MNAKQPDVEDLGGSAASFGINALMPSNKVIDFDMLAMADEDIEEQEKPSMSQQAKEQMRKLAKNHQPQPPQRLRPQQVVLHKGQPDRVSSLGMGSFTANASFSASLTASLSDGVDNTLDDTKKRMSGLSLGSNCPSITISAATMDSKNYRLDDDVLDGSNNSFGDVMLPSRAIDSDMLAIVDETWTEDGHESPSGTPAKVVQLEKLDELDEKTASISE